MPLQIRVILMIALVLLFAMALAAVVAGYEVRRALTAELAAGLGGARQTAASTFVDLPTSDHPSRDLRQLVATFDGNRHVRASLLGPNGQPIVASLTLDPGPRPPRWFHRLITVMPANIALPVPATRFGPATLVLTPTPDLDVRATWNEFLALMSVLAATAAAGLMMIYAVLTASFRPLTTLADRFRQIGAGDYTGRVAETGAPELLHLQCGFNLMAGELEATVERNRLLAEQLATLQEEERADIARDLHDEIGPHLFAVNLDAEMIAQLVAPNPQSPVHERAREIQSAVHYMQRHVRELLGRLRPTQATEFGLNPAIEDLVRSWATRQPDIAFELALAEEEVSSPTAEIAYRIVQEGVNNAVRHGQPGCIRIAITRSGTGELLVSVVDNGTASPAPTGGHRVGSGLGLVGMRERVEAGGGSLVYGPREVGWRIEARLLLAARGEEKSR